MNRIAKFLEEHQYITLAIVGAIVIAVASFEGWDAGRMKRENDYQNRVITNTNAPQETPEMAAIRKQGYYTVSPTPTHRELEWYAARTDHSDCIVSGISPGAIIAHYNEEGDHVEVTERDGEVTVSTNKQEFYFFRDYQTCVSARIIPTRELAEKYR